MADNRVNFSIIPFPDFQWTGDIAQLAQLLAEHLQGLLDHTVFTGQEGGTAPLTDVGPWLKDNNQWWEWDGTLAKYRPFKLIAGVDVNGFIHTTTLRATNTGVDFMDIDLPSKPGILATLDDLLVPFPTLVRQHSPVLLRWLGHTYAVLNSNSVVQDAGGGQDGQFVYVYIEQPPATVVKTLSWPAGWHVANTILTTPDATHRTVDVFRVHRLGTYTFVEHTSNVKIPLSGTGSDTTPPAYVSSDIKSGTVTLNVRFNELILSDQTPSDWEVKKNGTNVAVTTLFILHGQEMRLTLASAIPPGVTLTVRYIGTSNSLRDIAGNDASPFGPNAVTIM